MAADSERVKTGINGLDGLMEGGLERKSVVIVAGEAGSGKTTFALQFLYNGITQFKENGLFITFEEQKPMLYKHMLRYGWDFEKLEKEKKFVMLEYPPNEVDRFINESSLIQDIIKENDIKRVVVDSVTSLVLLHENEFKRRQAFLKTMNTLRKWGATTLLTSEGRSTPKGDLKARFGVEYLGDGLVAIHTIRKGDVRESAVEIVKLRGTAHAKKMCPVKIMENGVVVFPTQTVFGDR